MCGASQKSLKSSHDARSIKGRSPGHRSWTAILGMVAAILCFASFVASGQTNEIFRLGFTSQAFGGLNENDAMAAIRAWAQAFMSERKIQALPETTIFRNLSEIEAALSGGTVEAVNMTMVEYAQTRNLVADDVVICGVIADSIYNHIPIHDKRSFAIRL